MLLKEKIQFLYYGIYGLKILFLRNYILKLRELLIILRIY